MSAVMSYSTKLSEVYRQLGVYVGRVLKGEKPADLLVVRSTKIDLPRGARPRSGLEPERQARQCQWSSSDPVSLGATGKAMS
jgi:hypothetical protein